MQEQKGCLYMFFDTYKIIKKDCPCLECIVKVMCEDRFNICRNFHNFLCDNMVVITPYASQFNTKHAF